MNAPKATTLSVSQIISRRLRAVRNSAGRTQEWLAESIGLSVEMVSRIERGRTLPSVETLIRLCTALSCTPNDLLLPEVSGDRRDELIARLRLASPAAIERVTYIAEAVLDYEQRGGAELARTRRKSS